MRAFVTGGHGFVGRWLRRHLTDAGDEVEAPSETLDITDARALRQAVVDWSPEVVYHLAALTHVPKSWEAPQEVFRVNALGTLNLLEAARACDSPPRVLVVGSAEAYGAASESQLPLSEEAPLRPVTPYAASKVAAEYLGLQAHLGYGLPAVMVRPFNHVGPGQSPSFVVSALARRIVEAQRSGNDAVKVGNLEPRRDFTDVRDVVRAYRMVVCDGDPGKVYNVCSGKDASIAELAEQLQSLAGAELSFELDPGLARPVEVPVLRGDFTRLKRATGWEPAIPLEETLADVVAYWRNGEAGS